MTRPRGLFAGLGTVDLVHRLDRLPGPDEKLTATSQEVVAGGPAANAALAFAALGGQARLITGLGRHPLAEVARRELIAHGVMVCDVAYRDDAPPVSAVRVDAASGARSVSSPDAVGAGILEAPPELSEWMRDTDVVVLDGHHRELALAVAEAAQAEAVPVVLDAGRWRPVFAALMPRAQFVVASADFTLDGAPADPGELVAAGVEAAARSDGANPLRWAVPGDSGQLPVQPVRGGDTLGAGDVLHGAVAFAVAALGAGVALALWPDVLRFGVDVASVRVAHVGARTWLDDPRPKEWAQQWMR